MSEQSYESLTPRRDALRRKWVELKSSIRITMRSIFYWILFKLRLGWKYGAWVCSINRYREFQDGRCMWCGKYSHNKKGIKLT